MVTCHDLIKPIRRGLSFKYLQNNAIKLVCLIWEQHKNYLKM